MPERRFGDDSGYRGGNEFRGPAKFQSYMIRSHATDAQHATSYGTKRWTRARRASGDNFDVPIIYLRE